MTRPKSGPERAIERRIEDRLRAQVAIRRDIGHTAGAHRLPARTSVPGAVRKDRA